MRLLLQIFFLFIIWFTNTVIATPTCQKVDLSSYKLSFPKADNQNQESEVKIGVSNFARSNILENSLYQKANLQESYVLENRTCEGNVGVVQGAGELVGKYDWGIVKRYFQHIQDVTGRSVGQKQINKLKDALRAKEYKLLSESDIAIHRAEFNAKKNQIIKDWELETVQEWPKYTESVFSKNGTEIRKPGDLYDAHHIIENKFGGNNEWWNMPLNNTSLKSSVNC